MCQYEYSGSKPSHSDLFQLGKENHSRSTSSASSQFERLTHVIRIGQSRKETLRILEAHIPSYERTLVLIDAHYRCHGWLCRPVLREQLVSEIIPKVYDAVWKRKNATYHDEDSDEDVDSHLYAHQLAIFYAVTAGGATANLLPPIHDEEANRYEQLARIALSVSPVTENASLEAIQAVALLGNYQFFACQGDSFERTWKSFTFAMILGTYVSMLMQSIRFEF